MITKYLSQWAGMLSVLIFFGCSNAMQLTYHKPAAAVLNKGEVVVTVTDERQPQRGGEDPYKVGNARNAFGMPFAIKSAQNREPTKVIKQLISDCLMAAGYKIVDDPSKSPKLQAVLKQFWSDGYQHSRMGIHAPLELKKHAESQSVWKYNLEVNTGFTWRSAGFKQFNQGFNEMLDSVKKELLAEFNSAEFQTQVQQILR